MTTRSFCVSAVLVLLVAISVIAVDVPKANRILKNRNAQKSMVRANCKTDGVCGTPDVTPCCCSDGVTCKATPALCPGGTLAADWYDYRCNQIGMPATLRHGAVVVGHAFDQNKAFYWIGGTKKLDVGMGSHSDGNADGLKRGAIWNELNFSNKGPRVKQPWDWWATGGNSAALMAIKEALVVIHDKPVDTHFGMVFAHMTLTDNRDYGFICAADNSGNGGRHTEKFCLDRIDHAMEAIRGLGLTIGAIRVFFALDKTPCAGSCVPYITAWENKVKAGPWNIPGAKVVTNSNYKKPVDLSKYINWSN